MPARKGRKTLEGFLIFAWGRAASRPGWTQVLGFPFQSQHQFKSLPGHCCWNINVPCGHMPWAQTSTGQQNVLTEASFYWHRPVSTKNSWPRPCSTSGVRKIWVYVLHMPCRDAPSAANGVDGGAGAILLPSPSACSASCSSHAMGCQPFFLGLEISGYKCSGALGHLWY